MHTLMLTQNTITREDIQDIGNDDVSRDVLSALKDDPLWERDPHTENWRLLNPEQLYDKALRLKAMRDLLPEAQRALIAAMERVNLTWPLQADGPPRAYFEGWPPTGDAVRFAYVTWTARYLTYQEAIDLWLKEILKSPGADVMEKPVLVWRLRPRVDGVVSDDPEGTGYRLVWSVRSRSVLAPLSMVPA